jgi:hypothetical protein
MALRTARLGSIPDAIQYDDAEYGTAIEVDDPIRVNAAPANANDVLRQSDMPGAPANTVSSAANITDNTIVRGDGGAKAVQDSNVTIDDNGTVNIPTGEAYQVNSIQVVTDQQAAESDAAAISAITLGAGADTVDRTTFNTDLGTLVTEINAIRTTLNNLLSKLRTHGLIDT